MNTKKCSGCGETKPKESFHKKKTNKDGLNGRCKSCITNYHRLWYADNKDIHRERVRKNKPALRAKKYGLTLDEMYKLLSSNNGMCHCCNIHLSEVIDHDHTTGVVRGALCQSCNKGIGLLGDSLDTVLMAADYLKNNKHYAPVSPLAYNQ